MKKTLLLAAVLLFALSATAQRHYDAQRRTLFEQLPITTKDIVFLGNSITNGCEWAELFNNRHIKNRGINGDRASWMVERLDPIVAGRPKKIFLMIGVNDLSDGVVPQVVVTHIRTIIERFASGSPRTKIYVQSVLPVNDKVCTVFKNHYIRGAEILEVNTLLRALCTEMGVVYVDVFGALVDAAGDLDVAYSNDGLHLMGAGYMEWKKVLEPYLK